MKVKIIGGVAAMSMALATFVSFGITANAANYKASDLHTKFEAGTAPILVGGTDTIEQDGGSTWSVWTTYQSKLKLSYKTTVNASSNLSYAEAENEKKTTVSTLQNGRYKYWKIAASNKHRYDLSRYDYEITVIPNDPSYKAPTARSLTYNGNAQALANAATSVSGCTVKYSTENSNYSKAVPTATNAGKYTVYYKVEHSAYFNNNLDTTANFTVTINKANSTYTTEPAAKTLTWTGEAQELVTAGAANGGTVQYKLGDGSYSKAVPTATDAGTYTVYYKVVGDANHKDIAEKKITVTISKADAELTATPAAQSLTWTGAAQELVTAGTAKFGTVQYKLDDGSYSTAVPTATDAGDYTVYYKVDGNTNYNGIAEKSVTVTINKADAELTATPATKELTWTGEAQALVTAGTANGGEVQYSLDNINWSTDIPTATAVGSYTVYYKAAGDTDHNDTAVNSVTATIGAKAAEATYKNVMDFGGEDYEGEASAWTVTVTPGSTAIESMDVKVNNKPSDGALNNTSTLSGGSVIFGVVVNAAATEVTSMTAVVNGVDVPATLAE